MVTLERGNMWDVFGNTGLFMITTNPVVRKDGAVVMGAGIAKQAKDRFPTLPYDMAWARDPRNVGYQGVRSTGLINQYDRQWIGFFMVKDHWKSEARLDIIEDSITDLNEYAHHYDRIDLNFPGIGNGRLRREEVLPLLELLPDNVHVWEYG